MKHCSVEGCVGVTGVPGTARGLCSKHYNRLRRHGVTDESKLAWVPRDPTCRVPDCSRAHEGLGYCVMHYQRLKRHGDPAAGHHAWGLTPGYQRAHQLVREGRGPARNYCCAMCPAVAEEWSYDHGDPDELAGLDHGRELPYSLKIQHYQPLCTPCHRRFDNSIVQARKAS